MAAARTTVASADIGTSFFSFCGSASAFLFLRLFRHFRRVDLTAAALRFSSARRSHLAKFFLNRFHLLVQIVLALGDFICFSRTRLRMRFSTCSRSISDSSSPSGRYSRRSLTSGHLSSTGLFIRRFQRHMRGDGVSQEAMQGRQCYW